MYLWKKAIGLIVCLIFTVNAGAQENVVPDGYRLAAGDRLRITVYGHEDLSGDFEVDVPAREAAFSIGVLSSGQSAPPLHPGMVSLHEGQTTLEAGGVNRRSQPSSSADELGRFGALKDEPRPKRLALAHHRPGGGGP